ncbi:Gamma-butyrobetaine dioxygenase [Acipenser ruthenus]|uniref:Gamma-butyrobetaine dioxygenase n=1 Tax=Acipenser ruthenus TaxID=7906 RepID=A0A444UH82_ACIRT|nr:Gamma-butyrobetaine dioxygenase [Acipenser ruthenus]
MPPWMDGATPAIHQVQALDTERYVSVRFKDGTWSLYPYVWLWDNCQWAHCFFHLAKARKLLLADLDVTTAMERVTHTEPTKHTSEFDAEWLKKKCFSQSARQQQQEELFLNGALFTDTIQSTLVCVALWEGWQEYLSRFPAAFSRCFWHTWQVQDKADANNVAYTSEKLSLHSDYPALHNPPGDSMSLKFTLFLRLMQFQFLHYIKQAAEGGESEIVDGFHTANQLRMENPEAFRLLSSPETTVTSKCSPRT